MLIYDEANQKKNQANGSCLKVPYNSCYITLNAQNILHIIVHNVLLPSCIQNTRAFPLKS